MKEYGSSVLSKDSNPVLTEVLEDCGVTDLRNGLLPAIERIQENPALRILIKKHGKNRAVLMSSETYAALQRLVSLVVRQADALPEDERLQRAFQRLEEEHGDRSAAPPVKGGLTPDNGEVRAIVSEIEGKLQELNIALQTQSAGQTVGIVR